MSTTETSLDHQLADFDLFDDTCFARMDEVMEHARSTCPVAHTRAHGGMYLVTTFPLLKEVLSNPEVYSSTESTPLPSPVRLPPLDVDPPLHEDFRKFLNPFFTRPHLMKYEPVLRDLARTAIEKFLDKGQVDFIDDFAIPFTSSAAAKIVFDEDDPSRLQRAVKAVERIVRENSPESYQGLAVLAAEYLAERAETADDGSIISAIASATVDGRPLTMEEQIGVVTVLFIGGLDTTRGAISNIAATLAHEPDLEHRLRQKNWVKNDLDELLRQQSPVLALRRIVTRDVVLGDQQLTKGDILMLMYSSANRDAEHFPGADILDFDRKDKNHLAFGHGTHRCLGATFARMQIDIAFDELLGRITNVRPSGPDAGPIYQAGAVYAPTRLAIAFDRVDNP